MKIAFLHFWTLRLPRGVETLTLGLANALAECGEAVSILTAKRTRTPLVEPSPRVRVREFPTFRYYEAKTIVPFYAADLVREHYDVVVTFFADFGEARALQLAAPFVQPALVLYLTFPYASAPHRYHAYQQFDWHRRADLILADAKYTAERGTEFFQRPVSVLPSGTNPHRFKPDSQKRAAMRAQLGIPNHAPVLLNVSALERRKGTWRVIEALPQIRARCPDVRYLIMGAGSERVGLEKRAVELGVRDAVLFGGTTADLSPYYNAADIFVMLSDAEAGSIACLEAMASGLPVVVSNTGGFEEVVSQSSGRIVDVNSFESIAKTILELIDNPELRARLGMAGRATIIENYSWESIAEKFNNLVETCQVFKT